MFEITLDEMIYVLAEDMGLTDGVRFIDRTDRTPKKPFNQDMQPLKRPEKKSETGAARDIAAEKQPQPKQQQKPSKKEENTETVEHVTGEVEGQPGMLTTPEREKMIKSIIDAAFKAAMDSIPGMKEEYADEANAAMNVGGGNIVQQQAPQDVTSTPVSPTQVGVNDVVEKFVRPHVKPEKLSPKGVYGDALANGQEYTRQIQQQAQATQNQQAAPMLDVNAINSYIASLSMDKKDEYIRQCCMDEHYPDMKGLVQTTLASKVEKLKEICDFLPPEQGGGNRSLYSINLQSMLFALTGKYIKKILAKNGIPENIKFREIHSNQVKYRFAFVAEGDKASVTVYVNPVPILTQYIDDAGKIKYSWNVDTAVETVNKTA